MTFFSVFKNLRQILEVSDDLWERARGSLRIFISLEAEQEGVFIDSDRRILSFPVSVRDQPASVTFIFSKEGFKMAFEGVMLSSLYEKDFLQCHGDPKNLFIASVFLDFLLRLVNEEDCNGDLKVDSSHIH